MSWTTRVAPAAHFELFVLVFFPEKVKNRAARTDVCCWRKQSSVFVLPEAAGPTVGK